MGGNVEDKKEEKHKEDKDKDTEIKDECDKKEEKKKDKEKNPADKNDPVKLRQKVDKIDTKIQALMAKKEEIMKLLNDAGHSASNPPAPSS